MGAAAGAAGLGASTTLGAGAGWSGSTPLITGSCLGLTDFSRRLIATSSSGSSIIVTPFRTAEEKIVGVMGIIGPTRMNYARIIPMVDYTAKAIGRLLT